MNIELVIEAMIYLIKVLPIWIDLLFFVGLNSMVILPIIFNFFIIPNIEKRVGVGLKYGSVSYIMMSTYLWVLGGKYICRYLDVAPYIFVELVRWKLRIPLKINILSSLFKINYKVEEAPKFEVFMGIYCFINTFLFVVAVILNFFNS